MKVIILKTGEVKDVAGGYARNYLFPKKLAVVASEQALKQAQKQMEKRAAKLAKSKKEVQEKLDKIKDIVVKIQVKTNEEGKMFGALTPNEIVEALEKQYQIVIPVKWVEIKDPIKQISEYNIDIKEAETELQTKLKIELHKK